MKEYFSNEKIQSTIIKGKDSIACLVKGSFLAPFILSIPSIGYTPPRELTEQDYCFTYSRTFLVEEGWTEKEAEEFCKNKIRMQMENKKAQLLKMLLARERFITEYYEKQIANANKRHDAADRCNVKLAKKIELESSNKIVLTKDGKIPLKKGDYVCFYDTELEKIRMGFMTSYGSGSLHFVTEDKLFIKNKKATIIIGVYRGDEVGFEKAYNVIRTYCATNGEGNILSESDKACVCYLSKNAWFYFSHELKDFEFSL